MNVSIVFLFGQPYPHGMAGTKHIQLTIDGMKDSPGVSVRVIVLRQSSTQNPLSGMYNGVPYETVIGDALRAKALLILPFLHLKAKRAIGGSFRRGQKNILFVWGPPSFDNLAAVRYARRLGFKIVFYVVEDDYLAFGISRSPWHFLKTAFSCWATKRITSLADGILVISSHLEAKFLKLTEGAIPQFTHPILVDFSRYPDGAHRFGDAITLFYSGSFGVKDGIPVLLDAFDQLAAKKQNIYLTLTGRGSPEAMRGILRRLESSPFREQIHYKGYLDDEAYQSALNEADIMCMTRVDTGYANAGFPFKLGEFLATGRPVIASRVSDVERVLTDRHNAMLVKPGNAGEIVGAVEHLLANPDEASEIGQRGRTRAQELFDYRRHGQALCSFLQSL